ncbi:MAG: hypothetical protein BWX85_00980 [Chloroflexi bacterium ADurb.Bin120]|jgi:hypothetical protein|uniref:hypothetical protein n=1 Tax=Candidatus Brevifilum fermentans TaxID=1986204 RepID=UPI0009C5DDF1|nr:hypothetical protein [Brevefilum fermentans]OQB84390.1 MAG: hypothetical protein BWX85_00980 [Chloroflexi bacterium ADurb.Bin120]
MEKGALASREERDSRRTSGLLRDPLTPYPKGFINIYRCETFASISRALVSTQILKTSTISQLGLILNHAHLR